MTVDERPTVHCLDALRELRNQRRGAGGAFVPTQPSASSDDDDPFAGPKLITDPAAFVATALGRNLAELTAMGERSGRNAAAHALGRSVGMWAAGGLPVDVTDALERIIGAADANGLVGEDGLRSVRESVKSGYQWGLQHPYEWQQAPRGVASPVDADLAAPPALPLDDDALLSAEVRAQRIKREARRLLDSEDAARHLKAAGPGYTWGEFVNFEFPDIPWLIADLAPRGGNVTLTAPFKTGKTTAIGELLVSLVTATPFLGQYDTTLGPDEVIAAWDYEMTPQLHQGWSRRLDHHLTDDQRSRVYLRHLRGAGMKLDTERGVDEAVKWLSSRAVKVWVLDPFARAYLGDENDNGAVTRWTDTLDVIKERAGVHTLFLPVHTGRRDALPGGERARGATRLDDWPDVRWLLARDEEGQRYFRASGRDVELDEVGVKMGEDRRLTVDGGGRKDTESRRGFEAAYRILPLYAENVPGMSLSALAGDLSKSHAVTKAIVTKMRNSKPPLVRVLERQRGGRTEVELWKLRHIDEVGRSDPFGQSD